MDKLDYIKQHLSIAKYFELVIVPDMPDYYRDVYIDWDNRPVVKCPLHSEDTGSFRYFHDTKSFYCYGCGAGGDIVELHKQHQLLNNNRYLKFEAIEKELYELAMNDGERIIKKSIAGSEVIEINNVQDILKFNIYLNRWLRYIKQCNKETKYKFEIIKMIYMYRDGILSQAIKVDEAINKIQENIV